MSMNLYFQLKNSKHLIDFPFQTPTDWTWEMMEAKTLEERVKILRSKQMDSRFSWLDEKLVQECISMLSDDSLELTYL